MGGDRAFLAIFAILAAGLLISCGNNAPESNAMAVKDSTVTVETPAIVYPYTAAYSSDFSAGDPNLIKVVLDMYKAVEDNRMDELGQYYNNSVYRHNFAQTQR